jgi:parallel beta-helix repeat protein
LPSPTIEGDYAKFLADEVTNRHKGICFILGSSPSLAEDTVIQGKRIHNCGRLQRTDNNHSIYVCAARGTSIMDNWIYNNADRGIQLYPDADNTLVANNVQGVKALQSKVRPILAKAIWRSSPNAGVGRSRCVRRCFVHLGPDAFCWIFPASRKLLSRGRQTLPQAARSSSAGRCAAAHRPPRWTDHKRQILLHPPRNSHTALASLPGRMVAQQA